MDDKLELIWRVFQEHCTWERHHEAQRGPATSLLLVISAGILGVITYDGSINPSDLPLSIFLILQGLFGAIFVEKQYECFAKHQRRANKYREMLDEIVPDARIIALRKESDKENAAIYPRISKVRLHRFWSILHLLIAIIGVFLSAIIIYGII